MSPPQRATGRKIGRAVWVAVRVAFAVVMLTVLLVLFAGVFAGSVFVAGRIISSGSAGEETVLAERRAQREANATFDQMIVAGDPVEFAGERTEVVEGGFRIERAYEIPVLARFEIESRFGTVSGVSVTWTETIGETYGFGDSRREVRDGYHGVTLVTTITE